MSSIWGGMRCSHLWTAAKIWKMGHLFSAKSFVGQSHCVFAFLWHLRGKTSSCFRQERTWRFGLSPGVHGQIQYMDLCVPAPRWASAGSREFSRIKPIKKNFWHLDPGESGSWSKFISEFSPLLSSCPWPRQKHCTNDENTWVLVPILPLNKLGDFRFL